MLEWRQAADDVHVATIGREFAGYTTAGPDGFRLHDAHAVRVGVFSTLLEAQNALRPTAPPHVTTPSAARRARRRRASTRARATAA